MVTTVQEHLCRKCGYRWLPRQAREPKFCPRCKRDWRTPLKRDRVLATTDCRLSDAPSESVEVLDGNKETNDG